MLGLTLVMACSMSNSDKQVHSKLPADTLYNVYLDKDTKRIKVICLGINCIDNSLKDSYDSWEDLPKWMKDKIAVLMMLEVRGFMSTALDDEVKGIGMRGQGEDKFWVYG